MLTQFFEGLLHVQFSVYMTGIRRQQCEVLTLGRVAVHLHIDTHGRQRLQSLKHCCDGRAIQQTYLYSKRGRRGEKLINQ